MMTVFEVTKPGTWLDYQDAEWSWKISGILQHLQSQFFEANASLNLFVEACSTRPKGFDKVKREADSQRRSVIQKQVELENGEKFSHEKYDEIIFETEVRFKREQWSIGRTPREFEHSRPFIYARTFLYALDAFDKFLGVLCQENGIPPEVMTLPSKMALAFPDLRNVRNTTQHLEDRARGLGAGRNPKPLDLKPVKNQLVHAPSGGTLILNSLNGSKYGSTMSDGHYGEVDVSVESMKQLHQLLNEALEAFRWRGPKQHFPSV